MSIINTVIEQYPQANGTIDVVERHTDHLGVQYMRLWKADGHDIEARARPSTLPNSSKSLRKPRSMRC